MKTKIKKVLVKVLQGIIFISLGYFAINILVGIYKYLIS
jgi:hypothetical protein